MKSSAIPEMRELAQEELSDLNAQRGRIIDELKILLIPKDPNDDKNVLVEIRAGTGGEEAALFARSCTGCTRATPSARDGSSRSST